MPDILCIGKAMVPAFPSALQPGDRRSWTRGPSPAARRFTPRPTLDIRSAAPRPSLRSTRSSDCSFPRGRAVSAPSSASGFASLARETALSRNAAAASYGASPFATRPWPRRSSSERSMRGDLLAVRDRRRGRCDFASAGHGRGAVRTSARNPQGCHRRDGITRNCETFTDRNRRRGIRCDRPSAGAAQSSTIRGGGDRLSVNGCHGRA